MKKEMCRVKDKILIQMTDMKMKETKMSNRRYQEIIDCMSNDGICEIDSIPLPFFRSPKPGPKMQFIILVV